MIAANLEAVLYRRVEMPRSQSPLSRILVQIPWQDNLQEVVLFVFFTPVSAATHMSRSGEAVRLGLFRRDKVIGYRNPRQREAELDPSATYRPRFSNSSYRSAAVEAQL